MSKSEMFRLKIQRGETGMPKFCTVQNMNFTGEVLNGEFDGTHYILDDGDMYLPETLSQNYTVKFSDEKIL